MRNKKLILVLGIVILIIGVSFYISLRNNNIDNENIKLPYNKNTNDTADKNKDADIVGVTHDIGVTSDAMNDYRIKLDRIIVGDKNFGTQEEGFWLLKNMSETQNTPKFIIADYSITAKNNVDLKNLSFNLSWEGNGGGLYDPGNRGKIGNKYGLYVRGSSMPLIAGKTYEIKTYIPVSNEVLAGNKIFIDMQPNNDYVQSVTFDITKYLK